MVGGTVRSVSGRCEGGGVETTRETGLARKRFIGASGLRVVEIQSVEVAPEGTGELCFSVTTGVEGRDERKRDIVLRRHESHKINKHKR